MEHLKHKLFGLLVILFISTNVSAQTVNKPATKPEYKVNLIENKEVSIEFDANEALENILILIVDSFGNTLFLDNQKDFKGIYRCNVDMSMYPKGNYYVNIKSEDTLAQSKISIK